MNTALLLPPSHHSPYVRCRRGYSSGLGHRASIPSVGLCISPVPRLLFLPPPCLLPSSSLPPLLPASSLPPSFLLSTSSPSCLLFLPPPYLFPSSSLLLVPASSLPPPSSSLPPLLPISFLPPSSLLPASFLPRPTPSGLYCPSFPSPFTPGSLGIRGRGFFIFDALLRLASPPLVSSCVVMWLCCPSVLCCFWCFLFVCVYV